MEEARIRLKQYLLGNLPKDEISEIDLRVIEDDALAEGLALAESDLIEDYLEGLLTADDLNLFRSNFLTSPERHRQLREISLLKKYARGQPERESKIEETARTPPLGFGNFLKTYMRPLLAGAAVVAAVAVIAVVWQVYFADGMSPLEKEYAELNKKNLSDLSGMAGYSAVSLSSGSFRDGSPAVNQKSANLTETVLFRLAFPAGGEEGKAFKAKVMNGSMLVFTLSDLHSYQNSGGNEVRVLVPKSILKKGQCQIILENTLKPGPPLTFSFSIE